jgi:molybdate transport system substrate-binding protein
MNILSALNLGIPVGKPAMLCCILFFVHTNVVAKNITVASAANFRSTLELLVHQFHKTTSGKVTIVSASSGVLFTQITHGAPFDIFLSADAARPRQLAGVKQTDTFIYALGQLAFWIPLKPSTGRQDFLSFDTNIAIANPKIAPYGSAAMQVLLKLKPNHRKLVRGNNINQAFEFVNTGNASAGLIALSQLKHSAKHGYWLIPGELYAPIEQHGILLNNKSDEAKRFVKFIQSAQSRSLISNAGYLLPEPLLSAASTDIFPEHQQSQIQP